MTQYSLLPIAGFLIGMLIISLGGGGGGIYVGILTVFFHISPVIAASTSLATIIPTTAVGSFSHWKAGNVNVRYGLTMLVGGAVGAVIGSLCSGLLPEQYYNKLTGVIMLVLSARMVFSYLNKRRSPQATEGCENSGGRNGTFVKALLFGLLGGGISGLIGLSGGGPVVAGLSVLGCGALEMVGTSVFVLCGIAIVGFAMHLGLGSVDWKLVLLLASGTMSGAFVGPLLLKRINREKLEKVLYPVILVMTVGMAVVLIV